MLELVKLSQHCLLELVRLNSDPYSPRGNFVRVRKNKVKPNNAPYYFFRLASLKQARMKQMVTAITDWIANLSYKYSYQLCNTLVYRIDVHARLLILRKNSPLHGLILVCTFIDFEKIFPPARLFYPAQQSYFGLHVY